MNQTKLSFNPMFPQIKIVPLLVGLGAAAIAWGIFWTIVTLPVSELLLANIVSSEATETTQWISLFIGVMPILMGLLCVAYGLKKGQEEAAYGFTLPD